MRIVTLALALFATLAGPALAETSLELTGDRSGTLTHGGATVDVDLSKVSDNCFTAVNTDTDAVANVLCIDGDLMGPIMMASPSDTFAVPDQLVGAGG